MSVYIINILVGKIPQQQNTNQYQLMDDSTYRMLQF
jgi:hypothetical protein